MYEKAARLMAEGKDVIHLEVGRPFADTPQHIKEATKQALDDGMVHYGDFRGNQEFRDALAYRLSNVNEIPATADDIVVTNGLTHAGYAVCMAALDPGDEVILLEPYYPQHINKIELAGGVVVTAPLDAKNNFALRADWIEDRITDKTRMIALVNPANPTGRVFTRDELLALADLAERHDLLVMSDEVYDQILYDGHQHISFASLPGMWDRTFSMFAFTKAYAMDGWRLGYLACPPHFMDAILKITMNDVAHVNVFIQEGGRAAIEGSQQSAVEMHEEDAAKRSLVASRLNAMPGVSCSAPEGTIYAFPSVADTGKTSQQIADAVLNRSHVVVESGTFYGPSGEGYLRVCFGAESYARIEEAMDRMESYFRKLARYND